MKAADAGSRVAGKRRVVAARVRVVASPVEVRQEVKEFSSQTGIMNKDQKAGRRTKGGQEKK